MKTVMLNVLFLAMALLAGGQVVAQESKNDSIKILTSAVCGQCKTRIETGMAYEKGVRDVVLDLETKIVTIRYNPQKTTPDQLRRGISKLGYDADSVQADPAAYKRLPACCKKDVPKH